MYNFIEFGIVWGGIKKNYVFIFIYIFFSDVFFLLNWVFKYFNGYVDGFLNLREDEYF